MSIMPVPPGPSDPVPASPNESQIISRWLWRQTKALVLLGLGMLLGAGLVEQSRDPNATLDLEMSLAACRSERDARTAQLLALRQQQARWVTVLSEPSSGDQMGATMVNALAALLGFPIPVGTMLQGVVGQSQAQWVVPGKLKPLTLKENAQYVWIDTQTKQTEGPFQPEAVK